jgi:uncharacterized protein DUF2397
MGGTGRHVGRRPRDGLLLNDAAVGGAGGIFFASRAAVSVAPFAQPSVDFAESRRAPDRNTRWHGKCVGAEARSPQSTHVVAACGHRDPAWSEYWAGSRATHFYGIDDDPQRAEQPTQPWAEAAPAPVETYLYRPGGRSGGAGTAARISDTSERKRRFAEQCRRERAELEQALARFPAGEAVALSELRRLDRSQFAHLLAWLERALSVPAGADGITRAHSADGTLELELHPPGVRGERALVASAEGKLDCPNYRPEVRPA